MSDPDLLRQRLLDVLTALERIPRHMADISHPDDFLSGEAGRDHMDAIWMISVIW
uniref:Uncharacterized protein n=1 Tax=Candidatus Kentrum sp. DK TaxID=2126562 RepID=A0A450TAP8_9GAMM|nr:MAG: hypothetical protein BECKDK2373C_GA0170839_111116 [Candidatus Kentron sp. DK]